MANPAFPNLHIVFSLIFFFLYLLKPSSSSTNPDLKTLLAFKSVSDKAGKLGSWNAKTDMCKWTGVYCTGDRVTRLVLENFQLSGSFDSLTSLTHLRVLSLKNNQLSGPIPDLSNLTALKLLFLSHNLFSGEFPATLTSLLRLNRLDLSFNNLTGEVPESVNGLTHLLTLRLEENELSGPIPGLDLHNVQDFNVSGNLFTGEIPESLSRFPESAFGQNPSLCGSPLQTCKGSISSDPTKPGSDGAMASPLSNPKTISSSPTSINPENTPKTDPNHGNSNNSSKISPLVVTAIILGDVLVLVVVSVLLYCYFWRNYKTRDGKSSKVLEGEKIVYSSSPYPNPQSGSERGKMVFFEGTRRFELEDLLRASAEMLGKGGFGTAYKAVLDDGSVVAVKRLKDANVGGKREFEQHMEVLGRLKHSNLVGFKAYYFAREEKLLVHDYMPNGSLFWLLHGNRGPGRTPLDWTTRLKIAAGAARGIVFIHSSCKTLKLTHGNIKSTNVLIDQSGNARLSDFGLSIFASSPTSIRSNGYISPEQSDGRKPTQRSDVYSFGVLLLELLTGKSPSFVDSGGGSGYGNCGPLDLPRWVQSVVREEWTAEVFDLELMRYKDIEEEMVGLLQIAMACTSVSPDQRPTMSQVVKMIEEIRGVEVSPCHDSVADSPCLSEDTGGPVSQ